MIGDDRRPSPVSEGGRRWSKMIVSDREPSGPVRSAILDDRGPKARPSIDGRRPRIDDRRPRIDERRPATEIYTANFPPTRWFISPNRGVTVQKLKQLVGELFVAVNFQQIVMSVAVRERFHDGPLGKLGDPYWRNWQQNLSTAFFQWSFATRLRATGAELRFKAAELEGRLSTDGEAWRAAFPSKYAKEWSPYEWQHFVLGDMAIRCAIFNLVEPCHPVGVCMTVEPRSGVGGAGWHWTGV